MLLQSCISLFHKANIFLQAQAECQLSPLEVAMPYSAPLFLLVSGLERESESAFLSLAVAVLDGHTFLFAGNGDGVLYQVLLDCIE